MMLLAAGKNFMPLGGAATEAAAPEAAEASTTAARRMPTGRPTATSRHDQEATREDRGT
jgi:hypothetical protein